ncbi:SET domain-containing protein [Backusella circina FSU 941]|nr:SET domain-containing protein [Backusella circina FSU 941]
MLQVVSLPGKGRGYVATTDVPAGVQVHVSEPLATTVSEEWMPETCLWCFDFVYPKKQKVRAVTPEQEKELKSKWKLLGQGKRSLFKNNYFCSEECKSLYDPLEFEQLMVLSSKIDYESLETEKKASEIEDLDNAKEMESKGGDTCLLDDDNSIKIGDDDSLRYWLNDAWDALTENLELYKYISDTEKTMCRLIASCLIRKYCNNDNQQQKIGFDQLFQIQNNELSYFKSCYNKTKLPKPNKKINNKKLYLKYIPQEILHVMKIYCFFTRATSSILPIDHTAFRDIYFRERSNSFGLWEKSNDSEDVTDDLELLGWGIYPSAVYFNHSCDANIIKKRQGRQMVFVTRSMIEKGQEACISYGNVDADLKTRRARLYENYNFVCQCTRCTHEEIIASLTR